MILLLLWNLSLRFSFNLDSTSNVGWSLQFSNSRPFKDCKLIIVDEISMVNKNLICAMDDLYQYVLLGNSLNNPTLSV